MRPHANALPPALPAGLPPQALPQAAAQNALFSAVTFAHAGDLLPLLKSALAAGASFDVRDVNNNDVFALAVIHDRPHAIGTLLALGAPLPFVQEDGIDLLMRAAMLDHSECCDELIKLANFDFQQTDREGRTALFIAAHHGSAQSARILLNAGAEASEPSYNLDPATLQGIFGVNHHLDGKEVTPLMVATARGDGVMVDLLMEEGAQANAGDFPPLHLAADAHDPDMIQRLIDGGAEVASSLDWHADTPLETAIRSDAPINCLRVLAEHFSFLEADAIDQKELLSTAIEFARSNVLALFLAHGAEPDEPVAGIVSVWETAATTPNAADVGAQRRLHLLTTCRANRWTRVEPNADNAVLAFHVIATANNDAATIASHGLYPSLAQGLQADLLAKPPGADWQSTRQSALYAAALYLAQGEPAAVAANANPPIGQRPAELPPDLEWQYRTDDGIETQRTWLQAAASALVQQNAAILRQALTLDFYRQMGASCPGNTRLDKYINDQLKATCGLPDSIIHLIARLWNTSTSNAQQWTDALNADQRDHFIAHQMLALVVHGIETLAPPPNALSARWMTDLQQIAEERMPLRTFASNPVAWLMRHEQRHDLRPVNVEVLSGALGCELGLPPEACDAIARGWSTAIALLAGEKRMLRPDALWRLAAIGLSPVIANALVTNDVLVLPRKVRELAEQWCVQQTGPLPGRAAVPAAVPVTELMEAHGGNAAPDGQSTPEAIPDAPPLSPAANPTSPEDMPAHSWASAELASQAPPPRPPVGRKRPAEPDTEPRKEARHQ